MYKCKSVPVGNPTGTDIKFSWYFYQSDVVTALQVLLDCKQSCKQSPESQYWTSTSNNSSCILFSNSFMELSSFTTVKLHVCYTNLVLLNNHACNHLDCKPEPLHQKVLPAFSFLVLTFPTPPFVYILVYQHLCCKSSCLQISEAFRNTSFFPKINPCLRSYNSNY